MRQKEDIDDYIIRRNRNLIKWIQEDYERGLITKEEKDKKQADLIMQNATILTLQTLKHVGLIK